MAQVAAAKEQANADKFIATTAATAAITQTKIQADVTRELSDNQRALSEKNLQVTMDLAKEQEANRKERLNIQLAALMNERQAQAEEREEVRRIEQARVDQQIAFAKQQADENLRLAKLAINTQLVAQGLSTGVTGAGERGRLTTAIPSGTGTLVGSGGTLRAVAGEDRGVAREDYSTAIPDEEASAGGFSAKLSQLVRSILPAQNHIPEGDAKNATKAGPAGKLLSAVKQGTPDRGALAAVGGAKGLPGLSVPRGLSSLGSEAGQFRFVGQDVVELERALTPPLSNELHRNAIVRGSTPTDRNRIKATDLKDFTMTVQRDGLRWRHESVASGDAPESGHHHRGAARRR